MKKKLFTAMIFFSLLGITSVVNAQAWDKDTKVLGLGLGASQFFHLPNDYTGYGYGLGYGLGGYYAPITGQLNFQGEFGIHKYVGLGFTTGIGGRSGLGFGWSEVNVPVGMIANFHFFQLIADKTGKDIHSDKLDVYAGLNVGTGIAAIFWGNGNGSAVRALAFGGFQAGARYYFTDKFGVNLEVGYGKSIVNGGMVFKL